MNKRKILDLSHDTTIVSRKSLFNEQDDFSDDDFIDDVKMKLFERLNSEFVCMDDDNKEIEEESHKLDNDDNEQIFRLFACGPPSKISLESKEIRDYNEFVEQMLRNKADNDESRDNPDHMKRINSVTFEQIIQESKIPWERHLVPNKVLNVPYNYEKQRVKPKRRKSKMRRDAEKKGLVKKRIHGGNCPGWPTGGKGYAYGWRSNIGSLEKICISSKKNLSFREKRAKSK
ncbi:unnamed protein product [Rhizophagus irregularis]|uniref:Uncharacterized protein n=1 Tax=Rhizophagus irregularis TaxID=588596 RepID=A0A2I1G8I1_9GLOM|nr:hypothetical protein RhiirA4_540765 [Rhizophagus irregularis]CAB4409941.1 unnamed protein product [Rhizophagus irregularis]